MVHQQSQERTESYEEDCPALCCHFPRPAMKERILIFLTDSNISSHVQPEVLSCDSRDQLSPTLIGPLSAVSTSFEFSPYHKAHLGELGMKLHYLLEIFGAGSAEN